MEGLGLGAYLLCMCNMSLDSKEERTIQLPDHVCVEEEAACNGYSRSSPVWDIKRLRQECNASRAKHNDDEREHQAPTDPAVSCAYGFSNESHALSAGHEAEFWILTRREVHECQEL